MREQISGRDLGDLEKIMALLKIKTFLCIFMGFDCIIRRAGQQDFHFVRYAFLKSVFLLEGPAAG